MQHGEHALVAAATDGIVKTNGGKRTARPARGWLCLSLKITAAEAALLLDPLRSTRLRKDAGSAAS